MKLINTFKDIVDNGLNELCNKINEDNGLKAPITYTLMSGGKRLRPILMLASYSMYNNNMDDAMNFALGLELIHNYSLVHDDLPSMDNDDYRRGFQTVHKKFNEAIAILTGDALLTHAFSIMLEDTINTEDIILRNNKLRVMSLISKSAGIDGMILGQIIDIEDCPLSLEELTHMYNRKTSDLFNAAILGGAIIGGAEEEELIALKDFSYHLGLMFQIKDDIMDFDRDIQIGKVTMLTTLGIEEGKSLIEYHYREAKSLLKYLITTFNRNVSNLESILNFIMDK